MIVVDQTLIYALVGAAAGVVCILLAVVVILVVRKRKSKASVDPLASYNVQMSQMPPALQSLPSTNNSPQYQYQDMPRSDVLFDSMAGNTIAGMLPPQSEVDDGPPSDAPPTAPQSNYVAAPDMTPPMSRGVSRTNVRDGGSMARAPSGIYDVFDESVVYSVFQ